MRLSSYSHCPPCQVAMAMGWGLTGRGVGVPPNRKVHCSVQRSHAAMSSPGVRVAADKIKVLLPSEAPATLASLPPQCALIVDDRRERTSLGQQYKMYRSVFPTRHSPLLQPIPFSSSSSSLLWLWPMTRRCSAFMALHRTRISSASARVPSGSL